jgi:hypothetical protein
MHTAPAVLCRTNPRSRWMHDILSFMCMAEYLFGDGWCVLLQAAEHFKLFKGQAKKPKTEEPVSFNSLLQISF